MMRIGLLVLGVLVCGLFEPLAYAANRVVVVDSVQTSEKLRKEARLAIDEALLEQAFEVATAGTATKPCESSTCIIALAKETDSAYALLVQGTASASGYRFSMEVRDGVTGKTLGSDSKECELCDARDFSKAMRERTSNLLARVQKEHVVTTVPIAAPHEPAPNKVETRPDPISTNNPIPQNHRSLFEQPLPLVGMGLGALGAALVGIGVYYAVVDGQCTSDCIYKRDTGTFGWLAVGSGVASMIGGAAMVIWGRDTGAMSVSLAPNQLWLRGRF